MAPGTNIGAAHPVMIGGGGIGGGKEKDEKGGGEERKNTNETAVAHGWLSSADTTARPRHLRASANAVSAAGRPWFSTSSTVS